MTQPIGNNISENEQLFELTDIQSDENEWLKNYCLEIGDWSHNGIQCTDLVRELTTAPGYGKDSNDNYLGGYDYVKQQLNNGNQIPLLSQAKERVKRCDNLILTGDDYDPAGHTVVVFSIDLPNDTIFYLDQNYNGESITPRSTSISSIENSSYVISATCKKPVNCQVGSNGELIIAAPDSLSQPEVSTTVESKETNSNEPSGSENGKIFFVASDDGYTSNQIYSIYPDGTGLTQLTFLEYASISDLVWSDENQEIAFTSLFNFDERPKIYKISTDGSSLSCLAGGQNEQDGSPDWSPDGKNIVYYSGQGINSSAIYIMDNEGNYLRELVSARNCGSPKWSPDGQSFVVNCFDGDKNNIYYVDINDNNKNRLTNEGNNTISDWSPDGQEILFTSNRNENYDIYSINIAGEIINRLTTDQGEDLDPRWSPDGQKIVFISDRSGEMGLYLMNNDGINQNRLTNIKSYAVSPTWSPDSQQIAYISDDYDKINILNIEDGSTIQLTNINLKIRDLLWVR
ncbi:MAG: hypothetical protein NTZ74_05130 [Chloroflexi bacterium]|nr:hypothetical protein [Chloroflexota bacterium]